MRIKMPAVRIAQADSDTGQAHQDILTCGVCQKPFALGDINKFIQHKVHNCNKENYALEQNSQESPDNDDAGCGGIPLAVVNTRRPSISAPIKKGINATTRLTCSSPLQMDEEAICSTPKPRTPNSSISPTPIKDEIDDHHENCTDEDELKPRRIKQELDSTNSSPDLLPKKNRAEVADAESNTAHSDFKKEVKLWFDVLLTKLSPYLYGNGGPIITVQVENEYGSYPSCNMNYKIWLRDLMHSYIKDKAILFTTDGAAEQFLKCGPIPNVFTTVDFGTSSNPNTSFSVLREYQKKGPLVNSEFYPGWLTVWEQSYQTISTSAILKTMEEMLALNASFNFYMFFGGTNFGFTNGANINGVRYDPQLTSYDYDAPLNEAGDPTEKYYAIRNFLSKHVELPNIEIPKPTPKGNYGNITVKPILSLFNYTSVPDIVQKYSEKTATFEEMQVYHGYMLYETVIPQGVDDPAIFDIYDLRDRAIVFVNEVLIGILSRTRFIKSIPLMLKPKDKLSLLVENQGRVNYGPGLKDPKGIITTPTLNGQTLSSWLMVGLPFKSVCWVENIKPNFNVKPPAFYYGELALPKTLKTPLDTYLDMTGWGKGVVFINDFNIGRYWPNVGPQVTLYVPGVVLKPAPNLNKIVIFETEFVPKNLQIGFTDKPYLNKTPPIREGDSQYP